MALPLLKKLFTLQATDYAALESLSDGLLDTLLRYPSLEPLVSPVAQAMLFGGISIPVVNATGSAIAANKAVRISGWDATTGRFKISLAAIDTQLFADAVTHEAIADAGTGYLRKAGYLLTSSGLNTSGAALGDPVYLAAAGALSLSAGSLGTQVVGYVATLAASGSVRIAVQAPSIAPVIGGLAAAATDALDVIISGSATILNGQTSIAVAGLPTGLAGKPVQVSFGASPTAAGVKWCWGVVSGTTLTISINVDNTADLLMHYTIDGR